MPAHFGPELFEFLRELRAKNDREWFKANKPRYEEHVKHPILAFINDFGAPLKKISKHFVADAKPVGGSLFRIYRDVRFSKDKSPYKTFAAAQFRHSKGKDVHTPGFYLHLEPDQVFAGAGIWHPSSPALKAIRAAIDEDGAAWRKVVTNKRFRQGCSFAGESLKRAPKGYDPEHEWIDDLKRKDFIVTSEFTEQEALQDGFLDTFVEFCKDSAPLQKFLTKALDVEY